jgi:phosphate transport system protein
VGQFALELDNLNHKLLQMGGMAEAAIQRSTGALLDRDENTARQVIQNQPRIARLEMEIDVTVTRLLALYQPVARDLRLLTSALKINGDLYRIGQLAVHIAERSISLIRHPIVKPLEEIPQMAAQVQSMLLLCLQAFVSGDSDMARSVLCLDDRVDILRDSVYVRVQESMQDSPEAVSPAVDLIFVARDLERIGDHATNIAEDVLFLLKGEDIRRSVPAR